MLQLGFAHEKYEHLSEADATVAAAGRTVVAFFMCLSVGAEGAETISAAIASKQQSYALPSQLAFSALLLRSLPIARVGKLLTSSV